MRPIGVRANPCLALAALVGACSAFAWGCNAVLGLDESTLAAVEAGLADRGADRAAADAQRDGTLSGGDGGACGQGLDSSALASVTTACALTVSCDPYDFYVNISECISDNFLAAYRGLGCLTSIRTCDDYFKCRGSRVATGAECAAAGARCDTAVGNAINCFATDIGIVENCPAVGTTGCGTYAGDGGSVVADCVVNAPCADAGSGYLCTKNRDYSYHCEDGVAYGINCSATSAICETVSEDRCANNPSTDTPCTLLGFRCNEAGLLVKCRTDLTEDEFDCHAVGLSCDRANGGAACMAPGCAGAHCGHETCDSDGKTMHVCVGGASYAIDCTKVGDQKFVGCDTFPVQNPDQTTTTYAYCYGGHFGAPF